MPTHPQTSPQRPPPPSAPRPATRQETVAGEAAPAPQAAPTPSTPTPNAQECNNFINAVVTGTLPHVVHHAQEGSPT